MVNQIQEFNPKVSEQVFKHDVSPAYKWVEKVEYASPNIHCFKKLLRSLWDDIIQEQKFWLRVFLLVPAKYRKFFITEPILRADGTALFKDVHLRLLASLFSGATTVHFKYSSSVEIVSLDLNCKYATDIRQHFRPLVLGRYESAILEMCQVHQSYYLRRQNRPDVFPMPTCNYPIDRSKRVLSKSYVTQFPGQSKSIPVW